MSVIASDVTFYGSNCDPGYDGAATLNGAIASTTAATFVINTPTGQFPSSGEFAVQIDSEIMWCTQGAPGNAAGTLTVIRGMFGTTAATHSNAAAVSMPAGAGLDITSKIAFADITAGHTADYVSSSASDTKVIITLTGRDSTGVLQSETKTLNGTTIVTGSQVWDRFEVARLGANTTITGQITAIATSVGIASSGALPASGSYYMMVGKEIVQVTAGQGTGTLTISRGQLGTTATVHQSGDSVYLMPVGDVAILDHTKIITNHTGQTGSANPSGTTPALMKLQAGDGASVSLGQIIRTLSGTGPNQIRTIIGLPAAYGTDIVAVSRSWGTVPDNTTTYDIWNGVQLDLSPCPIAECRRFLYNAASDVPGGSTKTFYQQLFAQNNNTATSATTATVQFASNSPSLPSGALLDLAVATAQNDAQSVANRQTAFSTGYGGGYVTQPSATNFGANSGNLASGATPNAAGSQGIIARTTLPAGTQPYKGSTDGRINFNTV